MPKKPSSTPVKKPVAKKAVRKTVAKKAAGTTVKKAAKKIVKKTVKKTAAKKVVVAKPETEKRARARVLNEHPGNLVTDPKDHVAIAAIISANAKRSRPASTQRKRPPADRINDPQRDQPPATSLVERVSDAIERELSKIECIIGTPTRVSPAQRIETESRARVLASLARTLKEVMRLREQERGAGDDKTKVADDDDVPRDLDDFRRELSRRLESMVAGAAPLPDGVDD